MTKHGILPEGEHMRLAVRWLSDTASITRDSIEAASQRFDLSLLEEELLFREFLSMA